MATLEEKRQEALDLGYTNEEINAYLNKDSSKISSTPNEPQPYERKVEPLPYGTLPQKEKTLEEKTLEEKRKEALDLGYTNEEIDAYLNEGGGSDQVTEEVLLGYNQKPDSRASEDVPFWERWSESLSQGVESFEDVKTGYDLALGDLDEREKEMADAKERATIDQLSAIPTLTARDIQRIAQEQGYIPAGMKIPSFIVEQILKSGPQMAVPILVGLGVGAVSGPFAPITAPLAGVVTYGLQQFGNFMNTQGLEAEAPEDLDVGQAAKWATITAPIGYFADRFTLGISSTPAKQLAKEVAEELAKRKLGKEVAKTSGAFAARGFLAEAPTEVLETWAEFHQAGIDTSSDEAYDAYFEAFWSAGAVGSGLGSAAGAVKGYKNFKNAELIANDETIKTDAKNDDANENTRQNKIKEITGEIEGQQQVVVQKKVIDDIKKIKNPTGINLNVLKLLGIKTGTTAQKNLFDKDKNKSLVDLNDPAQIDQAIKILDGMKGNIQYNEKAVKIFRNKLVRQRNKIRKEAKDDSGKAEKRKSKGVVTSLQSDADTTLDKLVQRKYLVDSILKNKNKKKKPKKGQKIKVSQVNPETNEIQNLEGTYNEINGDSFIQTTIETDSTPVTQSSPLNNTAIINPTKKDTGALNELTEALSVNFSISAKQKALDKKRNKVTKNTKKNTAEDNKKNLDVDPSLRPGKFSQRKIIQDLKNNKTFGQVLTKLETKFRDAMTDPQKVLVDRLMSIPSIFKTKFNVNEGMHLRSSEFDAKRRDRGDREKAQYGFYTGLSDTITVSNAADIETLLHEGTHAATSLELNKHVRKGVGITPLGKRIVKLMQAAKQADVNNEFEIELANVKEFITEGMNNPKFQKFLVGIQSPLSTAERQVSIWQDFVQAVQDMLGLGDISGTLLNDVIAVAPELFIGPNAEEQAKGYSAETLPMLRFRKDKKREKEIESELEIAESDKQRQNRNDKQKKKEENTKIINISDRIATGLFSFDAALNRAVKKVMVDAKVNWDEIYQVLLKASISQVVHAEELAQQFLEKGGIVYDNTIQKFSAIVDPDAASYKKVMDSMRSLASKTGVSIETMRRVATQAFTAQRAQFLKKQNEQLEIQAKALVAQGKKDKAKELLQKNYVLVDMTNEQIAKSLEFFEDYPELNDIFDMWIETKNNAIKFMVQNEIMSEAQAKEFIDVVDTEGSPDVYITFTREGQTGPAQFQKGLGDRGKFYKLKGSYEPVADVFDNMDGWIRNAIKRSVLNKVALNKIEVTEQYLPDDIEKVGFSSGENTVAVSRLNPKTGNHEVQYYQFSSPYYATAISGIERVSLPGVGFLSNVSNFLRSNVVLYPLFSLAQLPQDAVSAMFASGVDKPFMIPLRVVSEFALTLIDMSSTHKEMRAKGVVGGLGSYIQNDTLIDRDIKQPGFYNALRRGLGAIPLMTPQKGLRVGDKKLSATGLLNRIAMASDNAVRQAVFQQTIADTKSKENPDGNEGLAYERAFEIINFKRAGSHPHVTTLRQIVPFFGAALQALSVQGRVVTMQGITPQSRLQATKQFIKAYGTLTGMTLLYNILAADDEEFKNLDPSVRDRSFVLPSGFHIKLRPDIFTYLGKIMPEHVIQNIVYESEDNKKTWEALTRGAKDIVALNIIPQFFRPAQELIFNRSSRTGRDILPQSMEDLAIEEQFTAGTSETAKIIAQLTKILAPGTGIAPPKIDYFLRQYFGYTGGLMFMFLDSIIEEADVFKYERPTKSDRDKLANIPGMSAFISREYGNRHVVDYYELKKKVDSLVKEQRGMEKLRFSTKAVEEFKKNNFNELSAAPLMNSYSKVLGKIRLRRKQIIQMPRDLMDADTKKEQLDLLYKEEKSILKEIGHIRKNIYGTKFDKPKKLSDRN